MMDSSVKVGVLLLLSLFGEIASGRECGLERVDLPDDDCESTVSTIILLLCAYE